HFIGADVHCKFLELVLGPAGTLVRRGRCATTSAAFRRRSGGGSEDAPLHGMNALARVEEQILPRFDELMGGRTRRRIWMQHVVDELLDGSMKVARNKTKRIDMHRGREVFMRLERPLGICARKQFGQYEA